MLCLQEVLTTRNIIVAVKLSVTPERSAGIGIRRGEALLAFDLMDIKYGGVFRKFEFRAQYKLKTQHSWFAAKEKSNAKE